jgi:hypothetical protein
VEDAKPSSPLLEVKDEVLEEAPSAQEKPEEERVDMRAAEEAPQPLSRSPAGTRGSLLVLLHMELGGPGLGPLINARVMRICIQECWGSSKQRLWSWTCNRMKLFWGFLRRPDQGSMFCARPLCFRSISGLTSQSSTTSLQSIACCRP